MTGLVLFITAVALAMDAFAVSIAAGVKIRNTSPAPAAFRMGLCFGCYQALMPTLGWLLGMAVYAYIKQYGHIVALIMLVCIGGHMIYESLTGEEEKFIDEDCKKEYACNGVPKGKCDMSKGKMLLMLGLATSIDALAVGVSLSALGNDILIPVLVIGCITFCIAFCGVFIGKLASKNDYIGKYAEIIGGIVLIGIGLKIFFEQ